MKKLISIIAFLSVLFAFNITYKVNNNNESNSTNTITMSNSNSKYTTVTKDNLIFNSASASSTVTTKICVDSVNGDNIIRDTLYISGWAISSQSVKSVKVYIDGTYVGETTVGISRPDVDSAMNKSNQYKNASTSGFALTIASSKLTNLSYGNHTLKVTATGYDGTSASSTRTIVKKSPLICIDYVNGNNYIRDNLTISGWALNYSDVESVDFYIDGKSVGSTTADISRPDVNSAMNSSGYYKNASTSGFKIIIPLDELKSVSEGDHTLKIVATGYDGTTATSTRTIKKAGAQTYIQEPSNGTIISSSTHFTGWAVSSSGVKEIQVYVDDKLIKTVYPTITRTDVNNIINSNNQYYNAAQSGFAFDLSKDEIDSTVKSTHAVKIVAVSNDDSEKSNTRTLDQAATRTCIDSAGVNNYITDNLKISGWSISGSGVSSVDVYLNGNYITSTDVNKSRTDVEAVMNTKGIYTNASNSGFSVEIPVEKLTGIATGEVKLSLVSVSADGTKATTTKTLYKAASLIYKDSPSGSTINAYEGMKITGWAINASGTSKVQLYVDGTYLCDATTGISRTDVSNVYNKNGTYVDADKSGFSATLDKTAIAKFKSGTHTLTIKSTGNDGTTKSNTYSIVKASPRIYLDTDTMGVDEYTLSGWSVSVSGVSEIKVYINNTLYSQSKMSKYSIGNTRNDVNTIINSSGYYSDADKSGFSITIPRENITGAAKYSVKIVSVGEDGDTATYSGYATTPKYVYESYNITLAQMVTKVNANGDSATIDNISPDKIMAASSSGLYQFLNLDYYGGITAAQINTMLEGRGVLAGQGQAFIDAANKYNINPVYLAAHARIESGNGTSTLSKGQKGTDGKTYYNQFGICAYDGTADSSGLIAAQKYGWDSVYNSIVGGAWWINNVYINGGKPDQDSLYEMRFDPAYYDGTYTKCYSYATDVNWAKNIAGIIYDYRDLMSNMDYHFDIPSYKS